MKSLLSNFKLMKGMEPLVKRFLGTGKLFLVLALCFALCATALILPINAFAGKISNGILTLTVQDDPLDTAYAAFMLKRANEDQDTLTYAQFFSSYTTVSINGTSYRFGEGEVVTPAYATQNNEVIAVQSFGGVQVTQKLALTTGNSSKEDMLLIHYSAENKTDAVVLFSVRILIDPTLSKSETDTVQVNGTRCNTEKTFTGAEVADDWCIKDDSGTIVAYGILNGETGTPDRMQVTNWGKLYDHKIGYQTSDDAVIEDNAVAVIWDNKQLPGGSSMDFSTKYGLYSEDQTDNTDSTDSTDSTGSTDSTDSTDSDDQTGGSSVEDIPQTADYLRLGAPVILFAISGLCLIAFVAVNWKRRGN